MNEIRNFVALSPTIGTAGQPTVSQFHEIAKSGYEVVFNLAMPDSSDSISTEGEIVSSLGMTYIHLPVPFDHPKPQHVKEFCGYMGSLEDKKVFVHCIMNYRVSAFMYHYLTKVKGLTEDESRSEIFEKWPVEDQWQNMLSWSREEIGL